MPESHNTKYVTRGELFFSLFVAYLLMSFAFSPMVAGESAFPIRLLFWAIVFATSIVYLVGFYRAGGWRRGQTQNRTG